MMANSQLSWEPIDNSNDAAVAAARRQREMRAAQEAANGRVDAPQPPTPPPSPETKTVTRDFGAPTEVSARRPLNQAMPGSGGVDDPPLTLRASFTPQRITLSAEERATIIGLLDAREAELKEVAPLVAAFATAYAEAVAKASSSAGQIGHNNPPPDEPPMVTADIELATAAIASSRIDLSLDQQRVDVLRVDALSLDRVGKATLAFSKWLGAKGDMFVDAAVKSAGTELGKRLVQLAIGSGLVAVAAEILRHLP